MNPKNTELLTRREAIAAGVAGAAAVAAGIPGVAEGGEKRKGTAERLPVVYIPHGGGPWPFVDLGFPKNELDALATYLRELSVLPKSKPRALLVVSAHWEEPVPTVMTAERPPMLYDYYGFPPESYQLQWPAPGDPKLAARVRELLHGAGIDSAENQTRGYDHGTFVPLMLSYPKADIPTVQLSLKRGLSPADHLAVGRALAPLREEGVFIIGSGMSFHNMRAFGHPEARPWADAFDDWLKETASLPEAQRNERLTKWSEAPAARLAHPREEHLLPLMVIAGAAGADKGVISFNGPILGVRSSGVQFG